MACHIFQVFLGALSFVYFAKALSEGYLKSTITQIERRFEIPSSLVGVIDGSFEIGRYCRCPALKHKVFQAWIKDIFTVICSLWATNNTFQVFNIIPVIHFRVLNQSESLSQRREERRDALSMFEFKSMWWVSVQKSFILEALWFKIEKNPNGWYEKSL